MEDNLSKLGYSLGSPYKNKRSIKIKSNYITMNNTNIPLVLFPNKDKPIIVKPFSGNYYFENSDYVNEIPLYHFDGSSVVEYPLMQKGGWIDKYNRGGVTWRNEYQNGGSLPFQNQLEQTQNQQEYSNRVNAVKERMMKAETQNEEKPYSAINDTSGALGKYQWIPLYNPDLLEKHPDLSSFLKNPQAQEDYTSSKIPEYWATAYKLKEKYPELTKNYTPDDLALLTHFQGAKGLEKRLVEKTMDKGTKNNPSPNDYIKRSYGKYKKQNGGWLNNI